MAQPLLGPASWLESYLVLSLAPLLRAQTRPHRDAHCLPQLITLPRIGAGDTIARLDLSQPPPWKYHPEKQNLWWHTAGPLRQLLVTLSFLTRQRALRGENMIYSPLSLGSSGLTQGRHSECLRALGGHREGAPAPVPATGKSTLPFLGPKEWESNDVRVLSLSTAIWCPVRAGRETSQKPAG